MKVLFLINQQTAKVAKSIKKKILNSSSYQNLSFDFSFFDVDKREKVFLSSLGTKSDKIVVIDDYDSYSFIFFCKQKGYFCANAYNAKTAKLAALHNNANVLAIGYKTVCYFKINSIIRNFLFTNFAGGRHQTRLDILHNSFIDLKNKTNINFATHNDSIIIATDHAGYELKSKIIFYLNNKHFNVVDVGTYSKDSCDYPEFGIKLAKTMLTQGQKGIVICGSGMGICNSINKFHYLRCINAYKKKQLLNSFQYGINVLGFGGRFISFRKAKKMVDIFLKNKIQPKNNSLSNYGLQLKNN